MTPAETIYELLLSQNLGSDPTITNPLWPTFIAFHPDVPDESICVYDTTGRFDGRLLRSGEQIEHPGIQVMVRGKDYVATWDKANSIAKVFDAVTNFADSGSSIINISRTSPILPIGMETEGGRRRFLFSINAVLTLLTA